MTNIGSVVSNAAIQGAYRNGQELRAARNGAPLDESASFSEMVKSAASNAVESARRADEVTSAGLKGEIGTQQVVEATLEMESTLRVAVSVRDKVVQAYQEILRMPI